MKITMDETYKEYRRYTLNITDTYLHNMTEWLRKHTKTPEVIPDITEKMVYCTLNNITNESNISYRFCYPNSTDDWSYETNLFSQIWEYIDEDIWEDEYDVLDGETDDVCFDVEDYYENEEE